VCYRHQLAVAERTGRSPSHPCQRSSQAGWRSLIDCRNSIVQLTDQGWELLPKVKAVRARSAPLGLASSPSTRHYAGIVTPEELGNLAHLRRARDLIDRVQSAER
jgi:hypothetical protein